MPSFSLDSDQQAKLNAFLKEQYAKLVEAQKGTDAEQHHVTGEDGTVYPYLGAVGGGCTYEFSPTSLGTVCKVTFAAGTKFAATIDLTDYDSW